MIGRWVAALAAMLCLGWSAAAVAGPQVTTDGGVVSGVDGGKVVAFKGIPFAAPPVGPLRWEPPAPAAAWNGVRDGSGFGAICPQPTRPDGRTAAGSSGRQSEDCLYLNVWTPKGAAKAPVMVWIHGGAFRFGSGEGPFYDGTTFAMNGVVLVTINYRLGALGWFAHPALTHAAAADAPLANYGLMDQIAALQWVKRNIAAFGGDPVNVTVFGELAGGESVLALLATPSAAGLYAKAVVESGGGWAVDRTLATAEQQGVQTMTAAGVPADATLDQMRAVPPEKMFNAGPATLGGYGPITDGRLMTASITQAFAAGHVTHVPMIIGSNSYEASLMQAFHIPPQQTLSRTPPAVRALYPKSDSDAAAAIFTDSVMGAPAQWIATRASASAPVYLYYFDYVPTFTRAQTPGTIHGGEIPFVFGNWNRVSMGIDSAVDNDVAQVVHQCWVDFAKTGRPACANGSWPQFNPAIDAPMAFTATAAGPVAGFRKAQYDALDQVLLPVFLAAP